MKLYKIEAVQHINTSIEECWDFFSSPKNLQTITIDNMSFEIQDFDGKPMARATVKSHVILLVISIFI